MNIAYLIWVEDLESPIIRSQVIELLKELRRCVKRGKLYLVAFQPLYRFLLRRFAIKRANLEQIRAELKQSGIDLSLVPVIYPEWWFFAKWYQIPLILIQAFPVLLYFSAVRKVKLFHCRSYPVTLPALMVKKLFDIKVIFDPRSPFPEENIVAGNWSNNSLTYKIWKRLEEKYLAESDVTVAITKTYVEHFGKIAKDARFAEIPNNVDLNKFVINKDFRDTFRSKMGINEDGVVFVYSGSLGNHWNNPRTYAEFLIKLRGLDIKHGFLFTTPNVTELKRAFEQYNIEPHEYFAISAELKDVPLYLSSADFGLNFMSKPDIRMSIKTVEYLAIGLPIIINSNLLGARELVNQYDVGLVVDLNDFNLNELKHFIQKKDQQLSLKCRKVACEKFSTEKVAKQYGEVYLSLLE